MVSIRDVTKFFFENLTDGNEITAIGKYMIEMVPSPCCCSDYMRIFAWYRCSSPGVTTAKSTPTQLVGLQHWRRGRTDDAKM